MSRVFAFGEEEVSTSKLYMLRCVVAMAHADDVVCDAERAYVMALANRLPLTEEQYNALVGDLETPQKIEDLLPFINEPRYRGQIIYFARLMAYKDGDLHPSEESLLEKMHVAACEGLNMDLIKEEVHKNVSHEMALHDITIDKNRPIKAKYGISWLQLLDEVMLANGIDLIRD